MLILRCSGIAFFLAILAPAGTPCTALAQTTGAEQLPTESVAKLIAQLSAADFRSREQASKQLEKLGGPVLPALRKAAKAITELEGQRRIELVVKRIENALLKAEEKRWQELDAPRRGIKARLVKILARSATLGDQQVVSAVYLLTMGRFPTDQEVVRAQKQVAETNGRAASLLQLTRSLVQDRSFSTELADANVLLFKAHKDLAPGMELAKMLHRLNGPEFQKTIDDVAAALDKVVKTDEQFVNVAFLLTLSRFPTDKDLSQAVAHLKKQRNRSTATTDIIWAVMNTKEFMMAR
jgi:hypothetical protein